MLLLLSRIRHHTEFISQLKDKSSNLKCGLKLFPRVLGFRLRCFKSSKDCTIFKRASQKYSRIDLQVYIFQCFNDACLSNAQGQGLSPLKAIAITYYIFSGIGK